MRIDLLRRWLKANPYGYCDGMNFQTCRANESDCPYCMANVNCSDGNAAIDYYRELIRFKRMKPRKAAKIALMFADTFPSIMRTLDIELSKRRQEGGGGGEMS
jgi:hypothetical protein